MAVYRFRVYYEENEDIYRDIDIKSGQTFEQFHNCIQESIKFDNKHSASFFVSDDYWRKNQEITLRKEDLPLDSEEIRKKVEPKKLMAETKIAKFIEQPHQRFIYIFDESAQWTFLIEMVKIAEENPKLNYPACIRSVGNAPKQYKQVNLIKEENADPLMAALMNELSAPDEEAYKAINSGEEGLEDEDLSNLEGEEGEESEEEEQDEFNEDEGDSSGDYGMHQDDEH